MEARSISVRPDITFATTSARVTPTQPRATRFGEVLSNTVVQSAESAMRVLPGSPMMALAVRNATGTGNLGVPMSTTSAMTSAQGPTAIGARSAGSSFTAPSLGAGGATTGTQEASGVENSMQQSQDMNLYYLQLQENINAQNRSYSALSNVMKAQHETVKTAIGNIR